MSRAPKLEFIPVTFDYQLRNRADAQVLSEVSLAISSVLDPRQIDLPEQVSITSTQEGTWSSLRYKVAVPRAQMISRNHRDDIVAEMHAAVQGALSAHNKRLYTWTASTNDRGYGFYRRCW